MIGALQAAAGPLGWDAAIAGPGPGIAGSGSELGHGGMAALDTAHASLILGLETLIAPRMSSADPRPRHRGLSHHTETVLRMLLGDVRVPAPARKPSPLPRSVGDDALDELREACGDRHEIWSREAPVDEYADSGLPATPHGPRASPRTASSSRRRWPPATRSRLRRWRSWRRERRAPEEGGGEARPSRADRLGADGDLPVRGRQPVHAGRSSSIPAPSA